MEDVAEDYLNELINRSMIQVVSRNWNQRISKCRIHDLLRDLSISKAKEENFFDVYQGNANCPPPSANSRRHVAHSGLIRYFSLEHSNPHVRSFLLFKPDGEYPEAYHWKSLRVLDLNNISLPRFLQIGNLIHLRYLGFLAMDRSSLPMSIGNLVMLRTLDLGRKMTRSNIPDAIWKIKQLRYLRANIHEPLRLDTLELQTLRTIKGDIVIKSCAANLNSLRKLKLDGILSSHGEEIFDSIAKHSSNLQSLSLTMTKYDKGRFPTIAILSRCYNLYKLTLNGKVKRMPNTHHEFPLKLTKLTLIYSELQQDPMPILSKLPNSTHIYLSEHSYEGREMICSGKGFPQLQFLSLQGLSELEEWIVEEGAMPGLWSLSIGRCEKLMMVPKGLRFLTTLKEL